MFNRQNHQERIGIPIDVVEYLQCPVKDEYDVCLAFGILEYLPVGSLDLLFERCPAPVLCIGTGSGESYLQYKTRMVSYSMDDMMQAAKRHNWGLLDELDRPGHLWLKFWRM